MSTNEAALDTLHANSCPDDSNPRSKIEVLRDVIGTLASVDKETLAHLASPVLSFAAGRAGPDDAEKNRDSISGKVNKVARESVREMFSESGEELSEEFLDRTADVFCAALEARVQAEVAAIEEENESIWYQLGTWLGEEFGIDIDDLVDEDDEDLDDVEEDIGGAPANKTSDGGVANYDRPLGGLAAKKKKQDAKMVGGANVTTRPKAVTESVANYANYLSRTLGGGRST
jgi:hypothetical protein